MTCTRVAQKIAPSILEKSCKGEHRHQREGEESENFHVGLKLCGVFASSGFFWASSPDIAGSLPLQADPRLGPLWRLGEPVFHELCPGCRVPGGGVCPLELFMTCESSKLWQELVSRIWNFSLKAWSGAFSGASVYTAHPSGEPCEQLAIIYGATAERPVVELLLRPPFPEQGYSLLCFVSHHRYWNQVCESQERQHGSPL